MTVIRILPLALRLGVVVATTAAATWTLRRSLQGATWPGRFDQGAEDALDRLDEGVSLSRSAPLGEAEDVAAEGRQTNVTARLQRRLHLAGRSFELEAAALARFRIRKV